ncbi:ADP-ribosylation factor-like protein 9, partial [Oryzias latipes]|uniref:ADP-ribosylation factor-like protein 9 n=1 Tax=Oryzias latipes TaxID=8090 RepID=UPI000CE1B74A
TVGQCYLGSSFHQDTDPTKGFNAVSISKDDLHIEFLEIGGNEDLRPYWQRYLSKALLLVFVVDSSNPQLFPLAKKHLDELLSHRASLPLMVLANKQVSLNMNIVSGSCLKLPVLSSSSETIVLVSTLMWTPASRISQVPAAVVPVVFGGR